MIFWLTLKKLTRCSIISFGSFLNCFFLYFDRNSSEAFKWFFSFSVFIGSFAVIMIGFRWVINHLITAKPIEVALCFLDQNKLFTFLGNLRVSKLDSTCLNFQV